MNKKNGRTLIFENPPIIKETASIVGPKEHEGPMSEYFDKNEKDIFFATDSWEKAESEMVRQNLEILLKKSNLKINEIDYIFSGDLLNQCIGSVFGLKDTNTAFYSLYGACSTFGEALQLSAIMLSASNANYVIANASSHFCSAEKTFRFPLEFGSIRAKTSSWTVTGDGCALLSKVGQGPKIIAITTGRIVDYGIKESANMGAAMAPAAFDTIQAHFNEINKSTDYYDYIITGDLGIYGKKLLADLLKEVKIDFGNKLIDCGELIYDNVEQKTNAGGSGCGCASTLFCSYFYKSLKTNKMKKILLVPTGAYLNQTTSNLKNSIPSIAHAVAIEN